MADKVPIRAAYSGANALTGLATFATSETIGVAHGGTGLAAVGANQLLTGHNSSSTGALTSESNLTFDGTTLKSTGDLCATVKVVSPALCIGSEYVLPTADGSAGQLMCTNGSGALAFATAAGVTLAGSTNNTIATVTGSDALAGEANLTFDGSTLAVAGALTATGNVSFDGGSFVFNEAGADKDFRIEGDTEANLFMADASTDRIGIGTAAPDGKMHIFTAQSPATVNASNDELIIEGHTNIGMSFLTCTNGAARITWGDGSGTDAYSGQIAYYHDGDYMNFLTASTERMRIDSSGKVGIGTTAPAGTFEVQETNTTTYCLQDAYCGTLHVRNKVADASGNNVTTGIKFIVGDGSGDSMGTINLVSCCCNNSLSVMTFATRNVDGTVAEGVRMDGCQRVTISGLLRMGPFCKPFGGEGNEFYACCEANNACARMIISVSEGSTANPMGIFHLRGLCINGCFCSPYCIYAGGCISAPTKNFEIEHPLASDESPNKYNMMHLVHSTLEGPEYGVYYRGSANLDNGAVNVDLPEYFEALAEKTDATVQLTPVGGISNLTIKLDGENIFTNNSFCVCTDETGNQTQCFHWIVNGRRIDKHIRCSIGQGDRAGAYDDGRLCTTRWEYRGEMENINGLESMTCAELDDLINFNNTWDSNDPDFVTGYENVSKANKIIMIGNAFDAIQNSAEGGKEDFSEEEEE